MRIIDLADQTPMVKPPSPADSPAHLECRGREVAGRGDPSSFGQDRLAYADLPSSAEEVPA